MHCKPVRSALAGVVLAWVAVLPLSAQNPAAKVDIYRQAVDTYLKTGDAYKAVDQLIGWNKTDIEAAVKAVAATGDPKLIEAAALLHLEIGVAIVGISTPSAQGYFDLGVDLIDKLVPSNPDVRRELSVERRDEIARIRSTWLGVAASAFLAVTDPLGARPFLNKARGIAPKSPAILTLRGMVDEIDGESFNADDWDSLMMKTRVGRERARLLLLAQRLYEDALEIDPAYPLAQIRLGRVYHLFKNHKQAEAWLVKGRAAAVEASDRYVAAMFIGAFKQDQQDLAGAREAFEQALEVAPHSQNALVALSYVELMRGRPDNAQALVRGFLLSPPPDDVWWASKNGALDHAGLRWLRKRVRQ